MGGNGVKGSTLDSCLLCYKNGLCPDSWYHVRYAETTECKGCTVNPNVA